MKISVITVTWNAESTIRKTLLSLVNQRFRDFEVVLVDGASKDKTIQIAKDVFASTEIVYQIISEPDSGIYDAMNKGIALAKGEYVMFVNSGDEIHDPDTLENVFAQPVADIYYGRTLLMKNSLPYYETMIPNALNWRAMSKGMLVSHQSVIVKRRVSDFYDLNFKIVSDYLWLINALKKAEIVQRCDFPISKYLLDGFSETKFYPAWKERFKILTMHYGCVGVLRGCGSFLYYMLRWKILGRFLGPIRNGGK